MLNRRWIVLVIALLALLPGHTLLAQDDLPELVMAERPGYHPEGIEWDAAGERFLTGSLTEGGVFAVADDGTVTPLAEGVEGLASIGIHIDADNNRVLAAMSDFNATSNQDVAGVAALGSYDLETGDEIFFVDMSDLVDGGRNFANDVTVDAEGNAYVTNSFSPVIYQVDPEGNADVFLETEAFAVQGFGLNGIDYHPESNYLLVAVAGQGAIYKVPVDDPAAFSQVELPEPFGVDGMVLDAEGRLIAVATINQQRELLLVTSADDWMTAEIENRAMLDGSRSPTTVALRDGVPYVVHAHFGGIGGDEPVEAFEIMQVMFEE